MSDVINQNTEPLFIFDMPDEHLLSETISVKGEKGERGDPTKLSDLTNDTGFITKNVSDLTNYYSKTATDSLLGLKLDKTTFNAYEIPSDFFTAADTVSDTGVNIALSNTAAAVFKTVALYGNMSQASAPTPDSPINVDVTTGDQTVTITGGGTQEYVIELGDIELCKLGDYRDYIYKSSGKWYKHAAVGKTTLDALTWSIESNASNKRFRCTELKNTIVKPATNQTKAQFLCSHYPISTASQSWTSVVGIASDTSGNCFIYDDNYNAADSQTNFRAWLSENKPVFYYALATAEDQEITDATLLAQLDAMAEAKTYNGATNITISGDLAGTIFVEAFKNGWGGTVSGINEQFNNIYDKYYTKTEIDSYINVKLKGAIGDGVTDDTDAIQDIINNNPNKTIYFPDGVYIVSESITTSATDSLKTFLKLSDHAIIKASDDFSDDFVLVVGGTGTAETYANTKNKSGIDGGVIDCNGLCGGLQVINTHMSKVLNLNINNVLTTGLQIDESSNSSSDAWVKSVNIDGTNAQRDDAIGVVLNGFDNNIETVRTNRLHIGIQINGGGNWLTSCHPLYGDSTSYYEQSVGFDINANDTHLTDCYSDNFSTGFQVGGNYYFEAVGLFCYWYSNDNYNHTALKIKSNALYGRITNFKITFPTNGTNRGLVRESTSSDPYPDISATNDDMISGRITNLRIADHSRLTYKYSDPILLNTLNGVYSQTFGGAADGIDLNKWYPIAIFGTCGEQHISIHVGSTYVINATVNVSSDIWIHGLQVVQNRQRIKLKLGVGRISDLTNVYVLYYKVTDKGTSTSDNWATTATITSRSYLNKMFILPRTAVYSLAELGGISTITDQVSETEELANQNNGDGIFTTSAWQTSHTISLRNRDGSSVRPILIFIQTGNSTGIYGVFGGKIMPINTDNVSATINMSIDNDILTITTTNTSLVSYVML